jgi:tRNA nucleotidyltransferase/poly(A) polymerase
MKDDAIRNLYDCFKSAGFELYLVGGAVRDKIMGNKPHDYDFATNASINEMRSIFSHTIDTGAEFGTLTIPIKGKMFEVTTYRADGRYSDGRHPDLISQVQDIKIDLARRDFTMNAIALDPVTEEIQDPFCGCDDIKNNLIRCVGKAQQRFSEDPLRMLRAIRFAAQLGFGIDIEAQEAIKTLREKIFMVSPERIAIEINKMLMSERPGRAFVDMENLGLLELVVPNLYLCIKQEQYGYHKYNVFDHTLMVLEYLAELNAPLYMRLAGVFHDSGKPFVAKWDQEKKRYRFHDHSKKSVEIAKWWLQKYRYANSITNKILKIVEYHMELHRYQQNWSDSAIRRLIARLDVENLDDFKEFYLADVYATGRSNDELADDLDKFDDFEKRVEKILENKPPLKTSSLAINGHILMQLGIKPGKKMGEILSQLMEYVMDFPEYNTVECLSERVKNVYADELKK